MKTKKIIFGATLLGAFATGILCDFHINSYENDFGTNEVNAQSGTCCSEAGSTCIIGKVITSDHYYLTDGNCPKT